MIPEIITNEIEQNAEVFYQDTFIGEVFLYKNTNEITICTPEADYVFKAVATIPK